MGERHPIQNTKTSGDYSLERLGTEYGGWVFVDEKELYNSPIISAGLGEDASFDIEFVEKYNSEVTIVDPTPRAIQQFKEIKESLGRKKPNHILKMARNQLQHMIYQILTTHN